jgi:FMN-dependent NADH-azoreductase
MPTRDTEEIQTLNLLHIDSSVRQDGSATRYITGLFADLWRKANPDGGYVYLDFAKSPVPHMDEATAAAGFVPEESRSDAQRVGRAVSDALIAGLVQADVIVLGVPMYNFTIPSTLKAWLDRVTVPEFILPPGATEGPLLGKRAVVAVARGGAYGPGTPRESFDHQIPYLRSALGQIGLDRDLTFLTCEMTHAYTIPAFAQFKPLAVSSRDEAERIVRELAVAM